MVLSMIGEHAGLVWKVLENGEKMSFTQLKKATGFSDDELAAAMGWLAREGKLTAEEVKRGRKTIESYSLIAE